MNAMQQREAARQFYYRWKDRGREDEDARSYWIELLSQVCGAERVTERLVFEKKVIGRDGNTKRIDVYIPETRVLIEQKSRGIDLDQPQAGHEGKTPFDQALMYSDCLPLDEKPRWIILSNFQEIRIYDMNDRVPAAGMKKLLLMDLPDRLGLLDFLVNPEVRKITEEMELSLKAGELVGRIHDRFLEKYHDPMAVHTQRSLNILCVRLVFCLYAEDAGLFGGTGDAFSRYIGQYEPKDIRRALIDLFKVLDTPYEEREDLYLSDELAAFPYVNGGLFKDENIVIPQITQTLKDILLQSAGFDWSKISPTIFGAVFESTLNPETRRSGGMHYTSIENIHKVIDPLFLDGLKAELAEIKAIPVERVREARLRAFQDKLAGLRFLDPAAGSGNFLTETYLCLRRMENEVIAELQHGQIVIGDAVNPIKVSITQFYGIEINDFAVAVAKTALWIAENQMMNETQSIVNMVLDPLPLKTQAGIVEGNALRMDWNRLVPKGQLSYIMGNPPFVGHQWRNQAQVEDMETAFYDLKKHGKLDYVTAWYKKAADYMQGTRIRAAYVSTNSITQGESVGILWRFLFDEKNVEIQFAYRTFVWTSEATDKAAVHCVIIGFTCCKVDTPKLLFDGDNLDFVNHINGYLLGAPDVFIESRGKQLTHGYPEMSKGSQPTDGGNLILSSEERLELVKKYPESDQFIKRFIGSRDLINNDVRFCLWLEGVAPSQYRSIPPIMYRLEKVAEIRRESPTASVRSDADRPMLFTQIRQPKTNYLAVPEVSSQNRRYIPICFLTPNVIASNKLYLVPDTTLFMFGTLISNVHMAWMRVVCGRLKSDYSYSPAVYNNFPWSTPTPAQKSRIEQTAQAILDARALYPDASLADLYDELTMPPELRKAHQANDRAVMEAYGMVVRTTTESSCVAELMRRYQALTAGPS